MTDMTISRSAIDALTRVAQTIGGLDGVAIIDILDRCTVIEPTAATDNIREHVRPGETKAILDLWAGIPLAEIEQARDAWCAPAASAEAQTVSTPALREVTTEDAREASNVRRAVIYSLPCIEGGYKDHDELELAAMIVALESFRARLLAQGVKP